MTFLFVNPEGGHHYTLFTCCCHSEGWEVLVLGTTSFMVAGGRLVVAVSGLSMDLYPAGHMASEVVCFGCSCDKSWISLLPLIKVCRDHLVPSDLLFLPTCFLCTE